MKKSSWKSPFLLLLTAVIWGSAFVAQSVGMDYVGGFTFNCVRSLIGGLVLIPCIFFLDHLKEKSRASQEGQSETAVKTNGKEKNRILLTGGICCGTVLFVASNLQQFGIKYTTVGKAGFITAMYIIIVPLIGIFLKKVTGMRIWFSVLLAVVGLYLLCMTEGFSIAFGDFLVLLCAIMLTRLCPADYHKESHQLLSLQLKFTKCLF